MRLVDILSFVFFISSHCLLAMSGSGTTQQKLQQLRAQDKLEEYLYDCLDAFLEDPSPVRIKCLEGIDDSLWRPLQTSEERLAYVILKSNEGYYDVQFNRIAKAVSAYEKAWRMFDDYDLQGYDIVEYCLKPLGNAYSMLGDFESAEKIVKSYLLKARKNSDPEQLASAVINLSIIYYSTGRFNDAIQMLNEGLGARKLPERKRGLFYANLAKNYVAIEQYDLAMEMCNRALKYLNLYPVWESSSHIVSVYSTLSVIHQKNSQLSLALQNIQKANDIVDTSRILNPRTKAKLKIQQAGVLTKMGQPAAALSLYKSTLRQLIGGYHGVALPSKNLLYAENTLKEAFDGMASIYTTMDSLRLALKCYELSFEVEDQLRSGYNYRQAKYLQQKENRERAEKAILLLMRMHAQNGQDQYIKQAFEIAENTKSLVLKSTYDNRRLWTYVKNDSLAAVQKELNLQKAQLENAIVQERLKGDEADLNKIELLINQQNQLMIEMKEVEGKAFAKLGHKPRGERIDTDSLQDVLSSRHETMAQYFWGSSYLFRFVLDGKNLQLKTSDKIDSLKEEVRKFLSFFESPQKINNNFSEYGAVAFSLYDQLLPKEVDGTLVIIPDGILNFVPFEALVCTLPETPQYNRWSWVLNRYAIAYRSSAMEMLHAEKSENLSGDMLGVFPEFAGTPEYLKYSKDEYEQVNNFVSGKYLQKEHATREAFLENISHYPIVHLSTHASAGDLYRPPSIAFIDSALFLPEIYGLDIDNQLMVLSACETGLGKLHTGESAISLANGFVQAGVNNIVFSLWNVNDFSTSRLMAAFYKHLTGDSEPPYLALRHARQDYLQDKNVSLYNKSPYYWAAFVYYGDTSLRWKGGASKLWIIVLSVIGLLVFIFAFLKHRNGLKRRRWK